MYGNGSDFMPFQVISMARLHSLVLGYIPDYSSWYYATCPLSCIYKHTQWRIKSFSLLRKLTASQESLYIKYWFKSYLRSFWR